MVDTFLFLGMQMETRGGQRFTERAILTFMIVFTLSTFCEEQKYDAVSEILERKRGCFRLMLI
jgi:hypothetical protein